MTNVKNPVHRAGYPAFKVCAFCGKRFTALGLSRHWNHCETKIKQDKQK
jgi:hypothetical protein